MRIGNTAAPQAQEALVLPAQTEKRSVAIQGPHPSDQPPLSVEETKQAVEKINSTSDAFNIGLRFQVHEESDRVMVQVVDRVSHEVIKETPPEQMLKLAAQIQDMIGLLLDTKR